MKEYYGSISFSGEVFFSITAENKEEVKEKIYEELGMEIINTVPEKNVKVEYIQWELIDEEARGNLKDPFIHDIEIYEED